MPSFTTSVADKFAAEAAAARQRLAAAGVLDRLLAHPRGGVLEGWSTPELARVAAGLYTLQPLAPKAVREFVAPLLERFLECKDVATSGVHCRSAQL